MHDKIAIAVGLQQAGRLAEAESIYREILFYNPDHPEVLHFLGVLAGQAGHTVDAVKLITRSLTVKPDYADAYANLGRLLADQGNGEGALRAYQRVTELTPRDASAWFNLGIALRTFNQPQEALAAFQNSVGINPRIADAFTEIGNLYRKAGDIEKAIAAHSTALTINPRSANAHNNLGSALLDRRLFDEAITEFMQAVQLDSRNPVFHSNLGSALTRVERMEEAMVAFDCSLQLDTNSVDGLTGKAIVLTKLRQFDTAEALFKRSLKLIPNHVCTILSMGEMNLDRHDVQTAEDCFQRVLELDPQSFNALIGLGSAQRADGDFQAASTSFRRALQIDPDSAIAYKNLTAIGAASDPELSRLERMLDQPGLDEDERIAAGFGAGKLLDDAERFDDAFERYAAANALVKSTRSREGERFDGPGLVSLVDRQIQAFTQSYFASTRDWGNPSELPVFIVGMPRSGTTLVEQISASHPAVFGAGELNDIGDIAKAFLSKQGFERPGWTREMVTPASNAHLQHLTAMAPQVSRVIDKMPANVLNLALIADLFPNARVVLCERDPRDNCLSCYFQWFARNSLLFSYDLQDCATQYLQQRRLAAHWMKTLPLRLLRVQYEEMVADLEGQSRRLIDFLGLDWDARCLDFHKTKRTVSTASVWQVRQPIYTSSVGRWRDYQKHLGPLLSALNM